MLTGHDTVGDDSFIVFSTVFAIQRLASLWGCKDTELLTDVKHVEGETLYPAICRSCHSTSRAAKNLMSAHCAHCGKDAVASAPALFAGDVQKNRDCLDAQEYLIPKRLVDAAYERGADECMTSALKRGVWTADYDKECILCAVQAEDGSLLPVVTLYALGASNGTIGALVGHLRDHVCGIRLH